MANKQNHWRPLAWLLLACLLATGCRQQMAKQPAYRPLQKSSFFEDGRASRPLVEGTVARGQIKADTHFYHGKRAGGDVEKVVYEETFPFPVTRAVLERGQERFNIYCAVCHGRVGDGNGMIPQRGFTRPPSFHKDLSRGFKLRGVDLKLRDAPVGYYFNVITNGHGAMPDYAAQVDTKDRWAIIAYIRVLQYSQDARFADLTAAEKKNLPAGGGRP